MKSKSNRAARPGRDGPGPDAALIQRALLAFFDGQRRDLPWRREKDPYRVWVSEVMLQQTRAETVCRYYERWLQQFPALEDLAAAPLDNVLKAWEGLGYYSRARNLQQAAQLVRERHQGSLPRQLEQLRELPGVGAYTAGAIASIAFGINTPAVDGNVTRVLCRLLNQPRLSPAQLQSHAARLVPAERPGDFNQALMELGATICTPRAPRCRQCPVQDHCIAHKRGTQLKRPAPPPKKTLPQREFIALVVRDAHQRVLLRQRPAQGLLAGMWEFPGGQVDQRNDEEARRLLRAFTGSRARPSYADTIAHTFSHFTAQYHAYTLQLRTRGTARNPELAWVDLSALDQHALPTAQRRIAKRCSLLE